MTIDERINKAKELTRRMKYAKNIEEVIALDDELQSLIQCGDGHDAMCEWCKHSHVMRNNDDDIVTIECLRY